MDKLIESLKRIKIMGRKATNAEVREVAQIVHTHGDKGLRDVVDILKKKGFVAPTTNSGDCSSVKRAMRVREENL